MQPELEAGRHPEVAATAADGPEQVGVVVLVHHQQFAVGRDDLRGQQIVDGHSVLAGQVTDAATQGDAPDPDEAAVAESGREPVLRGGFGVLARGDAGLGPGGTGLDVDLQRPHAGQVQDDAALADTVPGRAVSTAADSQLEPGLSRQRHDARHLCGVLGAQDDGGPAVDVARVHAARRFVLGTTRPDDLSVLLIGEFPDREGNAAERCCHRVTP